MYSSRLQTLSKLDPVVGSDFDLAGCVIDCLERSLILFFICLVEVLLSHSCWQHQF